MAYTAAVWKDEPSKSETQKRVNMKLRNEFVTEMTPLLADPSWSNTQRLQYIRELANGQATSDPAVFFDETVYDCFFKPYIHEKNGKFSFANNPWTLCVARCIDARGALLNQSNFPVLQWYQNEQRLQQLARVGEFVQGTLRKNHQLSVKEKQDRRHVETICRRHGWQQRWHPKEGEPYFKRLLSWSNDAVKRSIQKLREDKRRNNKRYQLDMPWCIYLEMLRNANAHFSWKTRADYEELLFHCLPPRSDLLLAALRNFTLSRPQVRARSRASLGCFGGRLRVFGALPIPSHSRPCLCALAASAVASSYQPEPCGCSIPRACAFRSPQNYRAGVTLAC
ncbi:unnamed protein product [Effrenium voratum]|uniref:Uncharacterized protein n=1 Tax=Effrenium voratum TaxID=2562239 RepID=A0AA36NCT3_9DINO|nr:unnamed protein product [Effrenium voratum]